MPRTISEVSRRTAVALAVTVLAVVPVSGCGIGFQAATTTQQASGNGANADLGALRVRGLTLVDGPQGSKTGTLVMTLVNTGDVPDALTGVRMVSPANGKAVIVGASATGGTITLPRLSRTQVGYDSSLHVDLSDLGLTPTQFTEIELQFQISGRITIPVMSVLPTGIYAGIAPL